MEEITAWLAALARRRAARVVEVPGGFVVRHPSYDLAHDHNALYVTGPCPDAAQIAERELAGLGHRRIEALAPLDIPGWDREENVLMRWQVGDPGPQDAVEILLDERAAVASAEWQRDLPDAAPEVWRQLGARIETVGPATFLAVRDGDQVVARADLYVHGRTAQVEEVMTAPSHQGRGLASRLVREAVHRAQVETVFLVADADDWPRHLYARLGFAEVGRTQVFTRTSQLEEHAGVAQGVGLDVGEVEELGDPLVRGQQQL